MRKKMYDEEIENEEDTFIVADLEWLPQVQIVNFDDPNFTENLIKRLSGLTVENFASEVGNYQKMINSLPKYDEYKIRKEIASWNIGIPNKDSFDFETYSIYYSLQVQYKNRINTMISVVAAHCEILNSAVKSLKEMAVELAPGKNKYDKDAVASFTVNQFQQALAISKRLFIFLENVSKIIDFSASQMDKMSREHNNLARINHQMLNEGMANYLAKGGLPSSSNTDKSAEIKTRNRWSK